MASVLVQKKLRSVTEARQSTAWSARSSVQCGIHRPCLTLPRAFKALRVTLKVALAFLCLVLLVVWLLGLLFVVSVCLATLLVTRS